MAVRLVLCKTYPMALNCNETRCSRFTTKLRSTSNCFVKTALSKWKQNFVVTSTISLCETIVSETRKHNRLQQSKPENINQMLHFFWYRRVQLHVFTRSLHVPTYAFYDSNWVYTSSHFAGWELPIIYS